MRLALVLLVAVIFLAGPAASQYPTIDLENYPTFSKEGPFLAGETVTLTVQVKCHNYGSPGECKDGRVRVLGGGVLSCKAGGGAFAGSPEYQIDRFSVGEKRTLLYSCTMTNFIPYGEKQSSGVVYVATCPGLSCDIREVPSVGSVVVKSTSPAPTAAPRSPGFEAPFAAVVLLAVALLLRRRS